MTAGQQPDADEQTLDLYDRFERCNTIDPRSYERANVKRGLRNSDGTGVMAGVTRISNVHGYLVDEGDQRPDHGRLTLRGFDVNDLVENAVAENRFGYEELVYLLLAGTLPTADELALFNGVLDGYRELPKGFVGDHILTAPSDDAMNMLARAVLQLYADDPVPNDTGARHEVDTALSLISRLPRIAVLAHYSIQQYHHGGDMVWHRPQAGLSTAETILDMLRPDHEYTAAEARMLDIMLMLQAEHGGGNNSTFTCRVLTSSGTDAYAAYAGAISSLKGPKHGGANRKVREMCLDIEDHVADWTDEGQVADYLRKIVRKEAGDRSGLIYGMGHAVYTLSDPRAVICHKHAAQLAAGTEFERELRLLENVERLTPQIMREERGTAKVLCANIDLYTGFVYNMLGIPQSLYTPMFATARMAGWAAHRFEELVSGKRIIRPAYKSVAHLRDYVPLDQRAANKAPSDKDLVAQALSDADAIGD
jgi:citrate synthase